MRNGERFRPLFPLSAACACFSVAVLDILRLEASKRYSGESEGISERTEVYEHFGRLHLFS